MSNEATLRDATRNQGTIDYLRKKIFLGNNMYVHKDYANISGAEETVVEGTVMGIVGSTQKLVPCLSTATDGSQVPVAILVDELDAIAIAGTADDILVCNGGRIDTNNIVFQNGTDTLATPVTAADSATIKTMEQFLIENGNNFQFITTKDLSEYDN